jgi:hypothetical protein
MTVFSVCSNFVEKSGKDPKYLLNVLYPFVQDTPLRIALDGGSGKILEYYTEAIRNSGSSQLKMWLRYLLKNPSDNLEYINVKCVNVGKYETFVEVASRVVSEPHLIAWSLQDYKDVGAADKGVEIIERAKSIRRIRKVTRAIDETAGEMTAAVGAKNPKEGKIMINIFSGIQGSTIVSDSLVQGSFNHVKETYNADTAQALLKIAEVRRSRPHRATPKSWRRRQAKAAWCRRWWQACPISGLTAGETEGPSRRRRLDQFEGPAA